MSKNKKALSRDDRAKRNFYRLVLPAFIIFALVAFLLRVLLFINRLEERYTNQPTICRSKKLYRKFG